MTGFKGRSGRTFRAKLKIEQSEDGKWRVDFDEDGPKEPPPEAQPDDGSAPDGAKAETATAAS